MAKMIVVRAVYDPKAGVWLVESSDLPGLHLEGETPSALAEKLPGAVLDLLEAGGIDEWVSNPTDSLQIPRL